MHKKYRIFIDNTTEHEYCLAVADHNAMKLALQFKDEKLLEFVMKQFLMHVDY